jgi:CspA family cold shock protein
MPSLLRMLKHVACLQVRLAQYSRTGVTQRRQSRHWPAPVAALTLPNRADDNFGFRVYAGSGMAVGTVKWFNDAKGFGFIEPEGGGADVFAHFSAVQMDGFRTLKQGSKVSYDLVQGPKGDLAQNIRSLDAPAPRTAKPVEQGSSAA